MQAGDADAAVAILRSGQPDLAFAAVEEPASAFDAVRPDVVQAGRALTDAALAGDTVPALAALEQHRVLCAHRRGPFGVTRWSAEIERWLRAALPVGPGGSGLWYPGRPVLVTANDYDIGLFNGDTGVVVVRPEGLRVAFARAVSPRCTRRRGCPTWPPCTR